MREGHTDENRSNNTPMERGASPGSSEGMRDDPMEGLHAKPGMTNSQSLAPAEEKLLEESRQVEPDLQIHDGEFSEAPWQTLAL